MSFLTELANKIEVHLTFNTPGYYLTEEDQEAIILALRHLEKCYATSQRSPETSDARSGSGKIDFRNS
jgi:hypothetical protein